MTAPVLHQYTFIKGHPVVSTRAIWAVKRFPIHHGLAEQAYLCSVEDIKNRIDSDHSSRQLRDTTKIGAIVLNYFSSEKTTRCLYSLNGQGLTSVLVLDNSVETGERDELDQKLAKFSIQDIDFKIIRLNSDINLGFAAGVNCAIKWFEQQDPHDFYLLINNDTEAEPGMLNQLVHHLENSPRTGLVSPMILSHNSASCGLWYHRATGAIFKVRVPGSFRYLSGCCLLVNRKVLNSDLLDKSFFMYGEDVDLSWRVMQQGFELACVENAVIHHEGTGSSKQGEIFYEFHVVIGHLLLARKLATASWQVPIFIAGRGFYLTIRAAVRSIRYSSLIPITALIKAFLGGINLQIFLQK